MKIAATYTCVIKYLLYAYSKIKYPLDALRTEKPTKKAMQKQISECNNFSISRRYKSKA